MIQRKRKQSEVENKTTRFYSKKQESDVAKSLGGVRQPNSGATPFKKSDVVLEDFAIECKTKTKQSDSMTIHRSWLEKNEYEALFMGNFIASLTGIPGSLVQAAASSIVFVVVGVTMDKYNVKKKMLGDYNQ